MSSTHTPTTHKGATMSTTTIHVSAIGNDPADAIARLTKRLPVGMTITGNTGSKYQGRVVVMEVLVDRSACDVDDAWVLLTSYGFSPSDDLGAYWQSVKGVGC